MKRLLQGVAIGAIATMIVGFNWGGWMLGGTAKAMAEKSASSAVVAAIAPICVDQFQHGADAAAKLAELKKISTWQQATFVEKGGWAVMPGATAADSGVSQACATMLDGLK
ncbi:MAG: hypothetical protein ACHQAY_11710 [Hyphomicrobiales bacterium]